MGVERVCRVRGGEVKERSAELGRRRGWELWLLWSGCGGSRVGGRAGKAAKNGRRGGKGEGGVSTCTEVGSRSD